MPSSPGAGRVLIADGSGPLVAEPSWTRYDDLSTCRCVGFDSQSGRQSELDVTDTGTARVFFHDRAGVLNSEDLVGLQVLLQIQNAVTGAWEPRWRGHIDDLVRKTNPSAPLSDTELVCVDIFDYLGGVQFIPGVMGDVTTLADVVFYEDGPADDRATGLLDDAGIDPDMYVVFSLNVDVNETLYDVQDVILQALRDVADAEFPGIANVYPDRFGRVCVHGRFARFDPDGVSAGAGDDAWDFQRWAGATDSDVTSGVAQLREFAFNRPRSRIINSYVAWPRLDENGIPWQRTLMAGQISTDATSISAYGYRGRDATDLIIKEHKTNGNTGAEECKLFADFYVGNYSAPQKNVQTATFKSVRPTGTGAHHAAAATWDLMTRIDISDILALTVGQEGLAAEEFFVEGVQTSVRFLNPEFDMVTVTPNLTPVAYYTDNVFE